MAEKEASNVDEFPFELLPRCDRQKRVSLQNMTRRE